MQKRTKSEKEIIWRWRVIDDQSEASGSLSQRHCIAVTRMAYPRLLMMILKVTQGHCDVSE